MNDRPFKVLGIQQIAVSGLDKSRLRSLWVDTLGLELSGSYQSESENVDEDIAFVGAGPLKVEVDLMQPLDPAAKPRVQTPPLNHVGLWIDDLPAAVEWLGSQGVRFAPGGIRPSLVAASSSANCLRTFGLLFSASTRLSLTSDHIQSRAWAARRAVSSLVDFSIS